MWIVPVMSLGFILIEKEWDLTHIKGTVNTIKRKSIRAVLTGCSLNGRGPP
jgi:hypothetical protein